VNGQLPEALPMNGVSTGEFMTWLSGRKEILLTDWTVGLVLASLAVVVLIEFFVDAHSAVMAMLVVFSTTDTTKTTIVTVVW
jgi:hypothetical protein